MSLPVMPYLIESLPRGALKHAGLLSVIARVAPDVALPEGVRVVTRFGDIVTLRLPAELLPAIAKAAGVSAIEGARALGETDAAQLSDAPLTQEHPWAIRRPPSVPETGRGVCVAAVDWGLDFTHPDFRHADGTTRLLGLWDQRGQMPEGREDATNRWGYGRIFSPEEINAALNAPDPFLALGYNSADADTRNARTGSWAGSHGTHVLSIAGGNGSGGGPSGVAPNADLVFVHLSRTVPVLSRGNLGDSASVLEAMDYVFTTAGTRPSVINLSVGAQAGPHDGSTQVEGGIDAALQVKGRAIINSAGNYRQRAAHASGRVGDAPYVLKFQVTADDPTDSEIEIYYPATDRIGVAVIGPEGSELARSELDENALLLSGGRKLGALYHGIRSGNISARERHVNLIIEANAPPGEWQIVLHPRQVTDGHFHAWIERDAARRPVFSSDIDETHTTGTLCNSKHCITVGAVDSFDADGSLGRFSSLGPTRDGRIKPELVAPGVQVLAARSTPPEPDVGRVGDATSQRYTRKGGTSMAAPHVAGTVALMFEAAGRPLSIADTRALLFGAAQPHRPRGALLHGLGFGRLDIEQSVAAARPALGLPDAEEKDDVPSDANTADVTLTEEVQQGVLADQQSQTLVLDPPQIAQDNDIVIVIRTLRLPGDVGQYWADVPRRNKMDWAHPLSELELGYIRGMGNANVPAPLRMRATVDPRRLTAPEGADAHRLFGRRSADLGRYANYENRRRILAHYVLTHPATVRLQLGLYRLFRDVNPLHFALERGWQIGLGREMFTGRQTSRLGAAFEFVLTLTMVWGVGRALGALRPAASTGRGVTGRALDSPIYDLPRGGGGLRINNRWYTEHALERMAPNTAAVRGQMRTRILQRMGRRGFQPDHPAFEAVFRRALQKVDPRGVPPSVVEAEILRPGSTNVRVITANRKQVVVTVLRRHSRTRP